MSLATSANSGSVRELVDQLRRPFGELRGIGVLQDELVLRLGDGAFDGQILHRLHVERDAGQRAGRVLDPLHDGRDVGLALVMRLEVDQDAAAVERGVGAVDADEGGEAVDIGVLQDDAGELLLPLRHRGIGDRLRRFGDRLDHAGSPAAGRSPSGSRHRDSAVSAKVPSATRSVSVWRSSTQFSMWP